MQYVHSTFRQFGSARNVCIDPGSQFDFSVVESNVAKVIGDMSEVHAMTINHQDPDVAGNAPLFCEAAPYLEMTVSEEVWRLLQHMMLQPGRVRLSHGMQSTSTQQPFQFVPTPFCHFRGAMALYDPEQRILYSGDLFGGLNQLGRVQLLAEESDWAGIAQFHQICMPSREVLRYAVRGVWASDSSSRLRVPPRVGDRGVLNRPIKHLISEAVASDPHRAANSRPPRLMQDGQILRCRLAPLLHRLLVAKAG